MFEFCGHKHNIMQVAFLCIRFIFGFKITCTINWYMRIFIIIIIVIFTLSLKFRIQVCKEIVKYRIHDWIKYLNYFFFFVSIFVYTIGAPLFCYHIFFHDTSENLNRLSTGFRVYLNQCYFGYVYYFTCKLVFI